MAFLSDIDSPEKARKVVNYCAVFFAVYGVIQVALGLIGTWVTGVVGGILLILAHFLRKGKRWAAMTLLIGFSFTTLSVIVLVIGGGRGSILFNAAGALVAIEAVRATKKLQDGLPPASAKTI